MLRPVTALGLLALICACSPAEQCRLDASRELRQLDRQIAETRTDLARGYRLVPVENPFQIGLFGCLGRTDVFGFCADDLPPQYRRVRLNIPAEQAKLASLQSQRREAEARTARALAQCPQA